MKRLEKILLSKIPIWITVVVLTLTVVGAVMFGAIVKNAATHEALRIDNVHFSGLSRVALDIAKIPKNLHSLLFEPHPAEAQGQRFDGQAGLDFADTAHASGGGYLLLVRHHPKPRFKSPKGFVTLLELIDLSRRKTVHHWQLERPKNDPVYLLPDGSLITRLRTEDNRRDTIIRLDACSNVEWKKRLGIHHSLERDADGNFWAPERSDAWSRKPGLARFSPSGDVLTWIALDDVLARNGYRHLVDRMNREGRIDGLHVNDVEPVLRDGPFWRRGDLFVSLRNPSVVLLYRPATDEIVWLRQGPWMQQHDVDIVSDNEISVFSNNAVRTGDVPSRVLGANEVYVYDFATGEARSPWREAMRRHDVRTLTMGAATLFDDGGLMVEEQDYGRVLRLSAEGALLWSYVNRASDGRVYRLGWSRYLDAEYGAEVARSVAAAKCTSSGPQAGTAKRQDLARAFPAPAPSRCRPVAVDGVPERFTGAQSPPSTRCPSRRRTGRCGGRRCRSRGA